MKRFILSIIAVLALAGCNTTPPPAVRVHIPPAPKVELNVTPSVEKLKEGNASLKKAVESQKETIRLQQSDIADAIAGADALKKSLEKGETQADQENRVIVANLVQSLTSVKTRNLFLETKNGELGSLLEKQIHLTSEAESRATAKDAEASKWKTANDQTVALVKGLESERDQIAKERDDLKKTSASALVYKHWVIALVSSFALWTIVKNILMSVYPGLRLRI